MQSELLLFIRRCVISVLLAGLLVFFPSGAIWAAAILTFGPYRMMRKSLARVFYGHPGCPYVLDDEGRAHLVFKDNDPDPYRTLMLQIHGISFVVFTIIAWCWVTQHDFSEASGILEMNGLALVLGVFGAALPGSIIGCVLVSLLYRKRIRNLRNGDGFGPGGSPPPDQPLPTGPEPVVKVNQWFDDLEQERLRKTAGQRKLVDA